MKLRDRYDCVVLGDHPGAILASLMTSRLGLSALLIPHCGSQGLVFSKDKNSVIDPESSHVLGLGKSEDQMGLWYEIIKKMEVPALAPLLEFSARSSGAWLDHQYFQFNPLLEDWSHECQWNGLQKSPLLPLEGLLRKHSQLFLSFWQRYPGLLRKQDKRTKLRLPILSKNQSDIRSKLFEKEESGKQSALAQSKKILNQKISSLNSKSIRLAETLWHSVVEDKAPPRDVFDLVHLLSVEQTGVSLPGGIFQLRTLLMKAAQESGVHILDRTISLDVRAHKEGISHLFLGEEKKQVDMGSLVLGCSADQLKNLAQKKIDFDGLCQPKGWVFTVMLRLPESQVKKEKDLRRFMITEAGSPRLYVEFKRAGDYQLAGNAKDEVIFLRTILPYDAESILPRFQKMIAQRMLKACRAYFPQFAGIQGEVFPRMNENDQEGFSQVYGFPSIEYIPENLRVYSEVGFGPEIGIAGVFVVSGEAYPQLGSLGPAVAAVEAVHWLAHQSGVQGVFG